MHCPCGREKILANGLCASCYNLKRQDADAMAPVLGEQWVGTVGDWQFSDSGLRYRYHSYQRA